MKVPDLFPEKNKPAVPDIFAEDKKKTSIPELFPEEKEIGSTRVGDYTRSLATGLNRFGELGGRGIDVAGNILPGEGFVDKTGQKIEQFYKEKAEEDVADMSPAMKKAREKRFTTDVDETWIEAPLKNFTSMFRGDAWKSPAAIANGLLESAPSTIAAMGSGMAITKKLVQMGFSATMSGIVGSGLTEGTLAGAESSKDVYDKVIATPVETIRETDEYQKAYDSLYDEGLTEAERIVQAKELVADHAAVKTFGMVAATTTAVSAVPGRYTAKIFEGKAKGGVAKKAITSGVLEGFVEEAPQSSLEKLTQNMIIRDVADPDKDIWEGVKESGVEGFVQGLATGTGFGGVAAKIGKVKDVRVTNALKRAVRSGDMTREEGVAAAVEIGEEKIIPEITEIDQEQVTNEPFKIDDNSSLFETLKYNVFDKLSPVTKVYRNIDKNIKEQADFLLAERLRISRTKARIDRADEKHYTPIKKAVADAGLELKDVEEYLYARHAPEANQRYRETVSREFLLKLGELDLVEQIDNDLDKNPSVEGQRRYLKELYSKLDGATTKKQLDVKKQWESISDRLSGMQDSEASAILNKWEGNKEVQGIAKKFDALNQETLDALRDSGRLTQDEYTNINGTYEFYAPLQREGYENAKSANSVSRGLKNLGKDIHSRVGSTRRAVNILANSILNHDRALINSEKANVASKFIKFAKENPGDGFWEVRSAKTKNKFYKGNLRSKPTTNPNEISVHADGKKYSVWFNPDNKHAQRIRDTIEGAEESIGFFVNIMGKYNRWLAGVNTTYNPVFIASNFFRDAGSAFFNLTDTELKKNKGTVFKNLPGSIGELRRYYRGDKSNTEVAKRYIKAGGQTGWMDYGGDIKQQGKKIERDINLYREGHVTKKTLTTAKDFIQDYNTIIENGVRLAAFKTGIEKGMTDSKAAILAKELTVNFNQKGKIGSTLNNWFLFANAGIQGTGRIFRTIRNNPKAMSKLLGGTMATATMLAISNRSMGGEDEDGVPYYDQIDDYVKSRNMVFMIPNSNGDYVKIPLPWGYNVFWAGGTEIGDMISGSSKDKSEATARMIGTTLEAFNPVQGATPLQTVVPTVLDPVVQVETNTTFFGSPLMPEKNKFAKAPKPDSERYWRSARDASVATAKGINALLGGSETVKGAIDVSPETLDLIFDTLTGGAGRTFFDITDVGRKAVTGEEIDVKEVPGLRRFYGKKSEYKHMVDFQKNIEKYYGNPDKYSKMKPIVKSTESRIRYKLKIAKEVKPEKRKEQIYKEIEDIKKNFNVKFKERK